MNDLPEYDRHDALGLAALVREKQVTAGELLEVAIARVEERNPSRNAVVTKLYDEAWVTIADGLPDGPFAGVPFLLKDLGVGYKGAVTTSGSRFFADARADHDSELVRRYKASGLVIFGKTNTPEFGLATSTEPRLFGPARNPWKPDHSAGGSSGGAAVAVATSMVPAAHASDGGGSIRIPASACGLFGMKPTRARVPAGPDKGESWNGAGVNHAITRSVRDSAALLDAAAGPETGDPYCAPPPLRPYLEEVGIDPGRLRVAVTTTAWNGQPVGAECRAAVEASAKLCENLGHHIAEASPAFDAARLIAANRVIISGQVRAALDARGKSLGRQAGPGDVEEITWRMATLGKAASAADYAAAIDVLHATGRAIGSFFRDYDVLLTPTMCDPPYPLGVLDMMTDDVARFNQAILATIAFTSPFNAAGNPAMSMPLHWSADGLPVGVQFASRFGDEATLFRLAAQIEVAQPWAGRRPAL